MINTEAMGLGLRLISFVYEPLVHQFLVPVFVVSQGDFLFVVQREVYDDE